MFSAVLPVRLLVCGVAIAAIAAIAAPPGARAATAAQIIHALNLERADSGIPAGIVENRTWSHDCALHDRWMLTNRTLSHYEQPGTPGYTTGGAWVGPQSVLALGGPGFDFTTPGADPYLTAPFHLAGILNPRLGVMGAAEVGPSDCETTHPGYHRHAPHRTTIYTYPDAAAAITWFEDAQEYPSVPGDSVGLPPART